MSSETLERSRDNERPGFVWKPELYRMQLEAPKPHAIKCLRIHMDKPLYFAECAEYHGAITHGQANDLLTNEQDGAYLVRDSASAHGAFHTLSLMYIKFDSRIHHYKLYHETERGFYVRDKRYANVYALVADGLITMYLELKAPLLMQKIDCVNYQESPYMTLNKKKLKILMQNTKSRKKDPATLDNDALKLNLDALAIERSNLTETIALADSQQQLIVDSDSDSKAYDSTGAIRSEKPHSFKVHTFKGLNWCERCGNFLWGFTQQGVKCEDCGFIAHAKCLKSVPSDCVPDMKNVRGVFGIDLSSWLTSKNAPLPFVVLKCIAEIEARGLTCEGIYRLSGFADEVDALKLAFDTDGENTDLSESSISNINVVAGALKLYLRLLPVPLITYSAYPVLIKAVQCKTLNEQIASIRDGLQLLSQPHFQTLQLLMRHLNRVSRHEAINKMTAHNLATVFAPTLIGPSVAINASFDISCDIFLIELIVTHCHSIFQ